MKTLFFFKLLFMLSFAEVSYGQKKTIEVPMSPSNWELSDGAKYRFETFDGKETLLLNGKAAVKEHQFSNGTLEVDVYANNARSFAGITFRKQQGTMEEVYMRLHKSNQADAVQYTPIYNDESGWQLYREYQANVTFKNSGWNSLRVVVNGAMADVFVNNEKVLSVDNLKTDLSIGQFGLFALFNNRFSNFRITNSAAVAQPKSTDKNSSNSNIIKQWNLAEAFPYIEGEFNSNGLSKMKYKTVKTEDSGLLPISKYIERPSSGNFEDNEEVYTVASTIIDSDTKQVKQFFFDYSDKIIVYINGKAIYSGNNAFRSKGVQYQGHIDINANNLYINLKEGKNTIHCVIIDRANGWGLIGGVESIK